MLHPTAHLRPCAVALLLPGRQRLVALALALNVTAIPLGLQPRLLRLGPVGAVRP